MSRTPEQIAELRRRVDEISSWYHAVDLGDGIKTPGAFDMSKYFDHFGFPERMDGMRILDVGTSTGQFAYEFERRGAAEVVGIELASWGDCDWTPRYRESFEAKSAEERDYIDRQVMRAGFELLGDAFESKNVQKAEMPIYAIAPDTVGMFDLVFCGSMLMHVRDPILGVQRMRSVCKPDGQFIISIAALELDGDDPVAHFAGEWNQCNWWHMSPACLRKILECCDFVIDRERDGSFVLKNETGEFADPTYVCHATPRPADA